jgi:hypothetical protein
MASLGPPIAINTVPLSAAGVAPKAGASVHSAQDFGVRFATNKDATTVSLTLCSNFIVAGTMASLGPPIAINTVPLSAAGVAPKAGASVVHEKLYCPC